MCRSKRDDAAGDPKDGRRRTRPLRRAPLGVRSSQVAHSSGPTCGFVASPEAGPGASVGTLQLGYPLLLCQDSRSYPSLRPKELSSRTLGVRLHLTGPTVPDPLPARGRVRCHHVSQRWKCSAPVAADPDPRRWVRDLHVPIWTPRELSAQLAAREGSGAATCHADASG